MKWQIVIVGGGENAVPLIDILRQTGGVEIVGVYDTGNESPAMNHARQLGIKTSIQLNELLEETKPNLLLETSGSRTFQTVLSQISREGVRIVDAAIVGLLLQTAKDKEKSTRKEQLDLIGHFSNIFLADYDLNNILYPVLDFFHAPLKLELAAMVLFGDREDNVLIVGCGQVTPEAKEKLLDFIRKEGQGNKKFDILLHPPLSHTLPPVTSTNLISRPLQGRGKQYGLIIFGRQLAEPFPPDDTAILDLLAGEVALFIENESVKQDLATKQSDLKLMLDSMSEGVVALDLNRKVTLINPSAKELLGITDMVEDSPVESIFGEAKRKVFEKLEFSTRASTFEVTLVGESIRRVVKCFTAPMDDSLGKQRGWILLLTDVTKEKEVDRMKSEFVSTTSHELRTPLAAMKDSILLVLDGTTGPILPLQEKFLKIAKRNIERLSNLINDILDLSKIETGKMEIRRKVCDIEEVVQSTLEPLMIHARENGIELIHTAGPDLPKVECDPDRVTQVLINLVGNAIKFTPKGGKVEVKLRVVNRDLEFVIEDTGQGIDEKDVSRLFQRFQQLEQSESRKFSGTGLGLSICKTLVELHGGHIWVKSEKGKGSSFFFTIPIKFITV